MRWMIAMAMVLGLAAPALADSCYTRTYSAKHLTKNPNQTVRQMAVRFTQVDGDTYASIRVLFRDTDKAYSEGLFCWPTNRAEHGNAFIGCSVECDGGMFLARRRGNDAILVETRYGILVNGGCGGGDESDTRWVKDTGAAKTVYKLYQTDLSDCPAE